MAALRLAFFILIIALTGCATRGYHNRLVTEAGPVSGSISQAGAPSLTRPLEGKILVLYGAKDGDVSSKGIVIEARPGRPVRAAGDGRVGFVIENLEGYGKTILIEHSADYSTVYAGSSEILVKAGKWVQKGEPIARVGGGNLYFELRRRAEHEDPLRYF